MNKYVPRMYPLSLTTVAILSATILATVPATAAIPIAHLRNAAKSQRFVVQLREEGVLTRRTFRLALRGKVSRLGRTITGMNCAIIEATPAQVKKLALDPAIVSVTSDRPVRSSSQTPLDLDRAAIGTDLVNGDTGYTGPTTGDGVGVAVIDSGIMGTHPDLVSRISAFKDYVNGNDTVPYDDYGHGTHIAGLIGGSGAGGLQEGTSHNYRGVAPEVHFVGLKVLDSTGIGRISDVIAALDWCVAHKSQYSLRVVNLSLSATVTSSYKTDPVCQAAERAVDAGLVVVASAGNFGGIYGTVGAPGNDPKVITVGATNTRGTIARGDDTMASYSGRGPTAYDILIKPDIVAPGNDIISLRVPNGTLDTLYPLQTRLASSPLYAHLSGTSMSAAIVTGAVALMVDANSDLTPNAVKATLMFTSQVLSGYDPVTQLTTYFDPFTQGTGELNVAGAVEMAKKIEPIDGFNGNLAMSSQIGGEVAPWAGATIPTILNRPGLTWNQSLLWGGNTGVSLNQARVVWGSNVVWGGSGDDPTPPPRLWNDDLIYGNNVVWGGSGDDPTPPPRFDLVWGNNVVWGGSGDDNPPPRLYGNIVNANNVVWGGSGDDNPPPRILGDVTGNLVGGDSQVWGSVISLLVPDPTTGP